MYTQEIKRTIYGKRNKIRAEDWLLRSLLRNNWKVPSMPSALSHVS